MSFSSPSRSQWRSLRFASQTCSPVIRSSHSWGRPRLTWRFSSVRRSCSTCAGTHGTTWTSGMSRPANTTRPKACNTEHRQAASSNGRVQHPPVRAEETAAVPVTEQRSRDTRSLSETRLLLVARRQSVSLLIKSRRMPSLQAGMTNVLPLCLKFNHVNARVCRRRK